MVVHKGSIVVLGVRSHSRAVTDAEVVAFEAMTEIRASETEHFELPASFDVSQYVHGFGGVLQTMLASAIAPEGPSERDREVAELLESIWFSALVGWASGTSADADIGRIMQRAAALLLPAP